MARHCLQYGDDYIILANDFGKERKNYFTEKVFRIFTYNHTSEKIFLQGKFNYNYDDIGLIQVDEPFDCFNVGPVCLDKLGNKLNGHEGISYLWDVEGNKLAATTLRTVGSTLYAGLNCFNHPKYKCTW